jgi:hypothetical protein
MTQPLVGVIGAGGAVGAAVARAVAGGGTARVRLGARRPEALGPLLAELGERAEGAVVDATDPAGLARFCTGCRVVVNAVGPAGAPRARVAAAAREAGADYLDPGGDEALRRRLTDDHLHSGGVALLGAGVLPGLTGLVPRWLAGQGLEPPLSLTGYVATLDRMTPGTAAEFLHSLTDPDSGPNASWRAGARVHRDLAPLNRVVLPFFDGPVTALPYLSGETERLARALRLVQVRWYHVFDSDGQVLPALSRLQDGLRQGAALAGLAAELVRAVETDMFGRAPAQQLVFELAGGGAHRVAVLRASSTYRLTATVAAMAVAELLRGAVPAGLHFAADVLDPALVSRLDGAPGVLGLHLLDGPLVGYAELDQGAV